MNVAQKLDERLTTEQLSALRRISAIVTEHGAGLYLVGGAVRDILADVPHLDLDVMTSSGVPSLPETIAERLGGEVKKTTEFGTATLILSGIEIDLAIARREVYQRQGALPTVFPGTVEEDLARRDFPVNAMAIDLSERSWGDLLDPHGGLRDLKRGLIRVLHDNSFRDDATRILRAIRYAWRNGHRLEPHTETLIKRDVKYLEPISGERIRHELQRIFWERRMADMLNVVNEMGILHTLHPALGLTPVVLSKLHDLSSDPTNELDLQILALLIQPVPAEQAMSVIKRLQMDSRWAKVVLDTGAVHKRIPELRDEDVKRSRVYELLNGLDPVAVEGCAQVTTDVTVAGRLRLYLYRLQHAQPLLNGDDLIGMGVPQGPTIGLLLKDLLDAQLDGLVTTIKDEKAFVAQKLGAV